MDGKTETNYGYLRERGHKFAKIVLENYSKYRNTVAENYPAITDTKDNKVSFYGAFTYTFDNRYSFNFNIRADGSNQFGKDISTLIPTDMVHLRKMKRPRGTIPSKREGWTFWPCEALSVYRGMSTRSKSPI